MISEVILKKYLIKKQYYNNYQNENATNLISMMNRFLVIKQLKKLGAKENDIIHFGNISFFLKLS